ncbi:MAG: UPF0176 protein [Planctomycetota bacterium]|jgi:UPF0176 protein
MDRSRLPYNTLDKESLAQLLAAETVPRITLSFYNYTEIPQPDLAYRESLYKSWLKFKVLGRIYVANEGINAQICLPENHLEAFRQDMDKRFPGTPFKFALEAEVEPFLKLIIKTKKKIVADGLDDTSFDPANTGKHLSAQEFNDAMEERGTIVVDMRNHYESEVGHFTDAICPDVDTFREELPLVLETLQGQEDKKLLLYCTGGIRCEKASAYFKHKGFKDVNQLSGGIIDYARQVKAEGLESKFIGRNFVFDGRLGEAITDHVISNCHQCGEKCNTHTNCRNDACHLLFIQCKSCDHKFEGCCTEQCSQVIQLPLEEQKALRKDYRPNGIFKSRLRPHLGVD